MAAAQQFPVPDLLPRRLFNHSLLAKLEYNADGLAHLQAGKLMIVICLIFMIFMNESLAYNLFGFKAQEKDFNSYLAQNDDRSKKLLAVVTRVYFIDRLRYRLPFTFASFLSTPELNYRLNIEKQALELHLLCTCIDGLAGRDFLSFDEWLRVSKSSKKKKYHIDDDKIESILQSVSGDLGVIQKPFGFLRRFFPRISKRLQLNSTLHQPDIFRSAAHKLYTDAYLPHYGNHKAFLRFFDNLPHSLKELLTEVYVISDLFEEDTITFEVWKEEYSKWLEKEPNNKIRSIAEYFYSYHRNPYTHKTISRKPRNTIDWEQTLGSDIDYETAWDPILDVIKSGNKERIVRFRANPGEDEAIILRLVIAIGWLQELGREELDNEFIDGFRNYQMRRESMYGAMHEIEVVLEIWRYYTGKTGQESPYTEKLSLPLLPKSNVERLRLYLYKDTPLEDGLDRMIELYLNQLNMVNGYASEFNKKHFPPFPGIIDDPEERNAVKEAKVEVYKTIQAVTKKRDITETAYKLHEWFNQLVDRMM